MLELDFDNLEDLLSMEDKEIVLSGCGTKRTKSTREIDYGFCEKEFKENTEAKHLVKN